MRQVLSLKLRDAGWFLHDFAEVVAGLTENHNRAGHAERIGRVEAIALEDKLLGTGHEGVLSRLARVKPLAR